MRYYLTQEQFERLREIGNNLEDGETIDEYDKLIEAIGNQRLLDDGPAGVPA